MRIAYSCMGPCWFLLFVCFSAPVYSSAQHTGRVLRATPTDTLWEEPDSSYSFTKRIVCFKGPPSTGIRKSFFMYSRKNLETDSTYVLPGFQFELNKADIKIEMLPNLQKLADFLKANPDIAVQIGGHTNNNPSTSFANTLSTNRAKAVADWLVAHGVSQECVQYKGFGKTKPVASNQTAEGRRQNMRVDITILGMDP